MIFHENRVLADDSHEITCLIFSKIEKDVTNNVVCCCFTWRFKGKHPSENKVTSKYSRLYFHKQINRDIFRFVRLYLEFLFLSRSVYIYFPQA